MALVNPHPALKVSVPMNPMVDGWMGDDWFHNGAFRQQDMPLHLRAGSHAQDGGQVVDEPLRRLRHVHAGGLGRRARPPPRPRAGRLLEQDRRASGYDAFWSDQAVDEVLAGQPLKVPVMLVHSLWDQEDIYGAIAVYKAIKPKDTANDKVFLVMGPWHHGQEIWTAARWAPSNSAATPRSISARKILRPFLDQYLKDDAPKADIAPVTAFETGTNTWRRLPAWPAGCASGCTVKPTPLYLQPV